MQYPTRLASFMSLFDPFIPGPSHSDPPLSRDEGQGGFLNGQHLFIICNSGSYISPTSSTDGNFHESIFGSVAIDSGMNALSGNALNLVDRIREWSDDVGRMRGSVPLTVGEQACSLAMQGIGQRRAIWPESSIPLNATAGIIYAPIVYVYVNLASGTTVFTYTGTTLLSITAISWAGGGGCG